MKFEEKIHKAQSYLKEIRADGWLLYDFHANNYLAHLFLEIPGGGAMCTRRFLYWIPKEGAPVRIVHAIEPHVLDHLPGKKVVYLSWQSLHKAVKDAVHGAKKIAMEYSSTNPYISQVDGGTVDLVRSFGPEVVSSGPFLAHFTAVIDKAQGESQRRAASACDRIVQDTWRWIGKHLRENRPIDEYAIQQKILADFERLELVTDHPPIVAVNANSADPHYEPQKNRSSPLRKGDFLLIDLWAKECGERSVFGDLTKVAVAAAHPTEKQKQVFDAVRGGQKAAIALVKQRFSEKKKVMGWEVDDAARHFIQKAGFGDYFTHRTGHSIEVHLHGSGTHMDNLEMHDDRPILPGTCFSVEPGVYLPGEFGIRLESDVYVHADGTVEVTGGEQDSVFPLLDTV